MHCQLDTRVVHGQVQGAGVALHAHLDHDHCLETVILRGPTLAVRRFADAVCAERGVHHGKLNLISVELHLPHRHDHGPGSERHLHIKPAS